MGDRDKAQLVIACIGERAPPVPEQLVLHKRVGQRPAVDGYERTIAARTAVVDGPRRQFLTGPRFAVD